MPAGSYHAGRGHFGHITFRLPAEPDCLHACLLLPLSVSLGFRMIFDPPMNSLDNVWAVKMTVVSKPQDVGMEMVSHWLRTVVKLINIHFSFFCC